MGDDSDTGARLAELLAALSLGIDLGFGQPMEHVLRQCRIALRLCELAGAGDDTRAAAYYSALLVNVGCHTDAYEQAQWFGDDIALKALKYAEAASKLSEMARMLRLLGSGATPLHRLRVAFAFALGGHKQVEAMITQHARLARSLGDELRLPPDALDALGGSYERWDGKGWPGEREGEQIPLAARVIQLAEFVEVAHRDNGIDGAVQAAEHGSATQFDPNLVAIVQADAEKIFHGLDEVSSWDPVLDAEPALRVLSAAELDEALTAIARFVDLKSPFTLGHAQAVATLARDAAACLGLPAGERTVLYRAGLTAGFGRLGVSNAIWDKPGPLTVAEWERVRLAPQLTERILRQSPPLAPVAALAGKQRERLDGSGYPAGLAGDAIPPAARVLAAADSYQAMLEPRPHRPARSASEAAAELRGDVRAGRLDPEAVAAVLAAAGHRAVRRRANVAGLTAREIDVLRLAVRGLSNKQIAASLVVAPKTIGNHIEHIYTKLGVSNRAGAALFAMRNGLLPQTDPYAETSPGQPF
jgi:HD-GYP domain-containing protein (c-di-GMP phosphodiesterase class II)